jgi:phage host-nuclease inhibitor protein Gam
MILTLDPTTEPPEPRPDFSVHDRATLEWYVRQVALKHAEMETIKAQAAAMLNDLRRDLETLEFLHGAQARTVTAQLIEARRGNAKHLKTLFGCVGFRTQPARIQIGDAAQTLEWARQSAPDLLETNVNRLALLRRFTATTDGGIVDEDGERVEIPGVRVTGSEERFYIRGVNTSAQPSADLE